MRTNSRRFLCLVPVWLSLSCLPGLAEDSDTKPPTLADVSFSPSSVNVSTDPQSVTLNLSLTDDLSGVSSDITVTVSSPNAQEIVFWSFTVPSGVLQPNTSVTIDVLSEALDLDLSTGFSAPGTRYVNIEFSPSEPAFPLPAPGMTVVLPLVSPMTPKTILDLFRIDPGTGKLAPAIGVSGLPVQGEVDPGGLSVTFTEVAGLCTVVGLLSDGRVEQLIAEPRPDVLWPPNHSLMDALIHTQVLESRGNPVTLTVDSITSTALPDRDKSGQIIPDWQVIGVDQQTGLVHLQLRSERAGTDSARIYTVTLSASNRYGSKKTTSVLVKAPHDLGLKPGS